MAGNLLHAVGHEDHGNNPDTDGPVPDLLLEHVPATGLYVMTPCHRRAADWLMSIVGDVPVDDRCVEETVLDALAAGFRVSFAFQAQPRTLAGLPTAPDVH